MALVLFDIIELLNGQFLHPEAIILLTLGIYDLLAGIEKIQSIYQNDRVFCRTLSSIHYQQTFFEIVENPVDGTKGETRNVVPFLLLLFWIAVFIQNECSYQNKVATVIEEVRCNGSHGSMLEMR